MSFFIFLKEGESVRLSYFVNDDQKKKLKKIIENRKEDRLTRKDILELMGVNRDTYSRKKGGAIRSNRK